MADGSSGTVLDLVVRGVPLPDVLTAVASLVEARLPGGRAAVHLLAELPIDDDTTHRAASTGRDVVDAGCWASPFHGARREVLGVVAVSVHPPREPADTELDVLHDAAALAAVAVEHDAVRRAAYDSSRTHPLTRIPNRPALLERLRTAEIHAAATGGRFGVIMLSVDGMAPINESLGTSVGDAVLRAAAARLSRLVEPGDTVAHVWGSDFVVLAEAPPGREGRIGELADRARRAVAEPIEVDGMTLTVDVSVGLSAYGGEVLESARPEDEPLRAATVALDRARTAGAEHIGVYDPRSDPQADVLLLPPELRRGLDEQQLTLAYQPIVRLADDRTDRYEALLRWRGPRGMVSPDSFVPVAEQTGLAGDLGRYALERGLAELARVRRAGVELGLSVNLSVRQLTDERLPDTVAQLLAVHEVPAPCLTLEVTEGVLLRADSRGWNQLARLSTLGVRVSLDDFGAGYSQISYLRRFAFDEVKVDQNMIRDMATDRNARAITIGTIAFARAAELPFVAEGIERREQADELRDLGATHGQGYLFGAPQPSAEAAG